MSPILKCTTDDEERELEFELDYQLSLTPEQRFRMMFRRSYELRQALQGHDRREAAQIIKRP